MFGHTLEDQSQEPTKDEKPFDYSKLRGVPVGYVPIQTNVVGEAQGSLWSANFRNNTSIGAFMNSLSSEAINREASKNITAQEMINLIPRDLVLDYADRYIGKDPAHFDEVTAQIRAELEDKQLIGAHPWKSFGIGLIQQPFDPVNWLPLGELYSNAKRGQSLVKAVVGSGTATAVTTALQEGILQRNELTREASESALNVAVSGVIGGAMGAIGTGVHLQGRANRLQQIKAMRARRNATQEVMDIMTDKDKELDANGLLKTEDMANMPAPIRKAMNITPMNRLINSAFGTAKFFANAMFEHNYTLMKHLDEQTDGASVETLIRLDSGKTKSIMVDYQDIYYNMAGIPKGPFRGTRAKLAEISMTYEQFNDAVWSRLSTEVDHENSHVNQAADMLRDKVFEPGRKRAIELGLLDEKQAPKNAVGYIMSVYNKNKIIEQGGKSARGEGTFPQFLYEKFQQIQNQIKQFKESPIYKSTKNILDKTREQLKDEKARKRLTPKEDKAKLKEVNDSIKKLKEQIKTHEKTIRDAAPAKALNSDGELFSVVDDETLWSHVEQTVDHILGDSEGQMLNPILDKLKGGTGKPLKSRKMTITQDDMKEWHITDIPKLVDLYSRAMHPTLRLTEFAQKMGAKDIPEMREKFSSMIMKEYDEAAKGKTGKEAAQLRKQRDANIEDMNASLKLIQGVYGDGPNILNDSGRNFYQNFLKWNYIRLLGYMTISSMADAGIQVFVHGPYRFIHEGLVQSFSHARQVAKQDLKAIGYAIETELGTRIKSYMEHQGLSTNPGPFTKGLDALTEKFGNLSLMNQWNNLQQSIAGHIGINRTLQTIHKFVKGEKVSKIEMERVLKNGLDKKHWQTIYEFTKDNNSEGTLFADWTNWNITTKAEREALTQFQASVAKEIDNIVIVPGLGDKPLFAQTPAGKLIFQFKTFLMAATNRVMVSGIQRRHDINTYLGVLSMLSMGALSYVVASLVRGNEPDMSFENLSIEAIDKSGILGIWGELGNISAKALGFTGTSRYASRDVVGSLIGPSSGAISEVVGVTQAVLNSMRSTTDPKYKPITTKETQKLLRLAPYQNLFYLHQLNRKATRGLALKLGATDNE